MDQTSGTAPGPDPVSVAKVQIHLLSTPQARARARRCLAANRAACGIESGLHQRLDVSDRDDPCRVRRPKALRRMGLFRRSSHSLFKEWRRRQKKPRHQTTIDYFGAMNAMNAEHQRDAVRCLHARHPSF
jgi:hypothetical protein